MPSSLSDDFFSLFPYLGQLDPFYIARHVFPHLLVHTHFIMIPQKGSRLLAPIRNPLCSTSSSHPKDLITISHFIRGRGVLSPEAINLSLWGEYNPPGFKAKQTQGWRVSNVITPLKLPAALKPSPQFNPGFFRVEYAANGRSCQGKGWEIKGFIKIGSCDGFFCMLFQQTGMKEPYHINSSGREPGSRVNHVRWPKQSPVLGAYQCTVI